MQVQTVLFVNLFAERMQRSNQHSDNAIEPVSATQVIEPGSVRSWSLRVIALLLVIQAAGLVGIGVSEYPWAAELTVLRDDALRPHLISTFFVNAIFLILAILAVLAALGVLRLLHSAWVLAMAVQAMLLFVCMFLYIQEKPVVVYPIMLLCIILVLYLNSRDVRVAFRIRSSFRTVETVDEY